MVVCYIILAFSVVYSAMFFLLYLTYYIARKIVLDLCYFAFTLVAPFLPSVCTCAMNHR